jgi:tRNA threonylcarbamoyladenosine modification (KEOPS) complex Cgi121 subunit
MAKSGPPKGVTVPNYVHCDALIDFVANCLARRLVKSALKRAVREAIATPETPNPTISARTIETLIKVARERMIARAAEKRGIHKGDAIAWLESVIADDRVHVQHKLSAQEQLTELLGLDARFELEERASLKDNSPAQDVVERLRDQLAAMDRSVDGD